MNTNSNTYTVIYTTIVVVLVAAILAFVSQKLGPMQQANEKAETVSQILTAAQFGEKEYWTEIGNAATLKFYKENIETALLFDGNGQEAGSLNCEDSEVYSTSQLKAQNYSINKADKASSVKIPVYQFKNKTMVIPVYGAGLWGPVWGYIAFADDFKTIIGAYFDHASETPGLGGKIKDDPAFRAQFTGKAIDYADEYPFQIMKGGAPEGKVNAIDAITGATMTSKGLAAAVVEWLNAYKPVLGAGIAAAEAVGIAEETVKAQVNENKVEE